jgi:hypothetical protein
MTCVKKGDHDEVNVFINKYVVTVLLGIIMLKNAVFKQYY